MEPISFKTSILPLFTEIDIAHMKKAFDLSRYEDVKANAEGILGRLMGSTGSVMPPPPSKGGSGPWPPERVALFKKWIDEGCNP
jgi:hypothetical protein